MAIPIEYYGVYRFKNYAYQNGQVLNAYGSSSLENGRNVMLYTRDENDTAQQWRAMYAGKYGEHTLYWLNCVLGGMKEPYALDRFTGALKNNADVYKSVNSSAQDQLVYFTKDSWTGAFYIHLYDLLNSNSTPSNLVLTAAPNPNGVNGNNSPTTLTQAGNVYWSVYADGNPMQKWMVEEVSKGNTPFTNDRATDFPADVYYAHNRNRNYPYYVGECTWYCNGRSFEKNGVSNFCTGDAADWINNYNSDVCECDKDKPSNEIILKENSIAVFGPTTENTSSAGHVAFIESVSADGNTVVFSECNRSVDGKFALSNKQIEVKNSDLLAAVDGYKQTMTRADFNNLYKFALIGDLYDIKKVSTQDEDA